MRSLGAIVFVAAALFLTAHRSYSQTEATISPESVNIEKVTGGNGRPGRQEGLEAKIDDIEQTLIENWPYLFPNQRPGICLSTETTLKELLKKGNVSRRAKEKIDKLIKECQLMDELSQSLDVGDFRIAEKIYQFENLAQRDKQLRLDMESKYREAFSKKAGDRLPSFHALMMQLLINSPEDTFNYINEKITAGDFSNA